MSDLVTRPDLSATEKLIEADIKLRQNEHSLPHVFYSRIGQVFQAVLQCQLESALLYRYVLWRITSD